MLLKSSFRAICSYCNNLVIYVPQQEGEYCTVYKTPILLSTTFKYFLFHAKGTAVSQSELPYSANSVDKNGTTTNYLPANLGTTSDGHTLITKNASFGSRHEPPPVSPHAPPVKPRTVHSYIRIMRPIHTKCIIKHQSESSELALNLN